MNPATTVITKFKLGEKLRNFNENEKTAKLPTYEKLEEGKIFRHN